jgi:hypothetical protein
MLAIEPELACTGRMLRALLRALEVRVYRVVHVIRQRAEAPAGGFPPLGKACLWRHRMKPIDRRAVD